MAKTKAAERSRRAERFGSREGEFMPSRDMPPELRRERAVGLGTLRRSRELTQVELAERLEMSQDQVSKLERRPDVKLSTVRRYLGGLGVVDAELAVTFEDGERATLPLPPG